MAEKSVKKTVAKKAPAKKPVAKATPAKKAPVKKTPAKKTVATPVVEKMPCGCDHGCACAGKCHGHKCGFWRKLIAFFVFFALGFGFAHMLPCGKKDMRGPRPEFDNNGCLVVKCPKMVEMMPMMDVNGDGCVDKAEFKQARKMMRKMRHKKPMPEQPQPMPAPEMPAPEEVVAE